MATSLRDNLTSSYFNAAHKLYSKKARRRIIAYVESYDDVAFWRTLLEEFEDDEHYFQVMLPSATSLAKGKKMVLMNTLNTAELGRSLIACVAHRGIPTLRSRISEISWRSGSQCARRPSAVRPSRR